MYHTVQRLQQEVLWFNPISSFLTLLFFPLQSWNSVHMSIGIGNLQQKFWIDWYLQRRLEGNTAVSRERERKPYCWCAASVGL